MVNYLIEENIIIYIFAGLCGLGFLTRLILSLVYSRLVRETENMGATKNKKLNHMKLKFETCYKLKIGVNNVDTFVDKNVYKHRFCGILLSTWENFGGQLLYLSLLLVPVIAVFGVAFEVDQLQILFTGAVGILGSAILILVDKSINLSNKKIMIKINLIDYFENFCKVRLEREAFHPEELEQYRREYFQSVESNKQIGATSLKTEPKVELDKRREARRRKEEEKRLQALKRAEELKKLEEARKEEERRRIEERKQLAAKRREEEQKRLEEERRALAAKQAELKKRAEEKQMAKLREQREQEVTEEVDKLLHREEEDMFSFDIEKENDLDSMTSWEDEIAAEKELEEEISPEPKASETIKARKSLKSLSPQEQKLVEDILKEFFA